MANPTAAVPERAQLRQLLFREKRFGHEGIQMVRAAHYATTTSKIAVDGFVAPANCSCNLPAGDTLKSRLDCQTPYVVAGTIAFHSALAMCNVPSRATFWRSDPSETTPRLTV